jgi:hypothetical protein
LPLESTWMWWPVIAPAVMATAAAIHPTATAA